MLADLTGLPYDVERAERVGRTVGDGHGEEEARTAYDCPVRVRRGP